MKLVYKFHMKLINSFHKFNITCTRVLDPLFNLYIPKFRWDGAEELAINNFYKIDDM